MVSPAPDRGLDLTGRRAVIFGAAGQDGYYLSQLCRELGIETVCVSRSSGDVIGDVADFDLVGSVIERTRPDWVFHLAALSTTAASGALENHAAISTGSLNVLEATSRHCPEARVFITGSGLQLANRGRPIAASDDFDPSSPYAVSRIHSVYTARYYRARGIRAYVGYLFHHESPRRGKTHVARLVSSAAARSARGSREPLLIGSLDVRKEWTFAGDVVRGIWTLVNQDEVFEAAIGSGTPHSIGEFVAACFDAVGLRWQDHVRTKDAFSPEYSLLVSDPSVIRALGWQTQVGLEALAKMMVEADLAALDGAAEPLW